MRRPNSRRGPHHPPSTGSSGRPAWTAAPGRHWPKRVALAALGCCLWPATGCGGEQHVVETELDAATVAEEVSVARVSLAQVGAHREADGVPVEIARAEGWLAELEALVASGDADDERAWLTLQVLKAQLSAIKAYYLKREAESALDNARGDYVRRKTDLDALEGETMRLLESTGDLP